MRETLYIRLRQPSGDAPTPYTVVATDGLGGAPASVFVREAPLSEVIAQAAGRKLVVFVPGAEVAARAAPEVWRMQARGVVTNPRHLGSFRA